MNKISQWSVILGSLSILISCDNTTNPFSLSGETHRRGKIEIYIEESYQPLFETSIYTYKSQFPKANIKAHYITEKEVIESFYANKTKTIFMTRDFTKSEKEKLRRSQIEVRSEIIAHDAVALIVHPNNTDTNLTLNQVKEILTGKMMKWPASKTKIDVVFDNQNSANFRYLQDLTHNTSVPANVFSVKSNEEVINYVKSHPNAIGVIGVNWISDEDDTKVLSFRNGISVVGVSPNDSSDYFKPYQAFIKTKEYPLTRDLWVINKASRSGLNTGFVNFLEGEKGQLIILKSSLVPANSPIRMIQMNVE